MISRKTEDYWNLICDYIFWLLRNIWNQLNFATFLKDSLDIFNPLPSLMLQSARDLNVLCWLKHSKALLLQYVN
jgi:hypothetical protein